MTRYVPLFPHYDYSILKVLENTFIALNSRTCLINLVESPWTALAYRIPFRSTIGMRTIS